MTTGRLDPHRNIRISLAGEPLTSARGAIIMLHGRGATARTAIELATSIAPSGMAIFAPQATEFSWYPHRFIRPVAENEPFLSSALAAIDRIVAQLSSSGHPTHRIIIGGFSQGACLALEYVARFPARFGGVLGFSGGLIGDDSLPLIVTHEGTPLAGTPIFLGSSDHDAHIPLDRVRETAAVFLQLGAKVTTRIYPGYDHLVNDEELAIASSMVQDVLAAAEKRD